MKDQIQTVLQRARNNEIVGFYEHSLTERHLSQEIALSTCRMLEHGRITRGSKGEKQAPHAPLTIVAPLLSRASKLATPELQTPTSERLYIQTSVACRISSAEIFGTDVRTRGFARKHRGNEEKERKRAK